MRKRRKTALIPDAENETAKVMKAMTDQGGKNCRHKGKNARGSDKTNGHDDQIDGGHA